METNKILTDQQLDDLILQSFERKAIADEIAVGVMKDLRRTARLRLLRKWGRVAAFSFGLPLVLVAFGWLLWPYFVEQVARGSYIGALLIFPIATMIYAFFRAIEHFSWQRV